jgi:hypothetical protein
VTIDAPVSAVQPASNDSIGKHPAPFTDSIIDTLRLLLREHDRRPAWCAVHDPFAGEGRKLGALCDQLGVLFTGTDLETWRDRDSRVQAGDSTDPATYPRHLHVIVTSPTYNNGVNDHFQPKDSSRRLTYRVRLGRPLQLSNTGRYSGRGSKRGEREYWRITREVVAIWPRRVFVNVKDSTRGDDVYPLVQMWTDLLVEFGYEVERVDVECPGWRFGTNSQARADTEAILIGVRP